MIVRSPVPSVSGPHPAGLALSSGYYAKLQFCSFYLSGPKTPRGKLFILPLPGTLSDDIIDTVYYVRLEVTWCAES